MKSQTHRFIISPLRGFTLIELVVCIALVGILAGLAASPLMDYKRSLDYKTAAREITSVLRKARSSAVSTNQRQMVVFKPNSSSYNWIGYNTVTSNWGSVVQTKTFPNTVSLKSTSAGTSVANVYVQFNTNGTANLKAPSGAVSDGNISINYESVQKYLITATSTGRVSITKK
jgi:type IV fimbrial biogenesis protein FimT